MGGCAQLPPRFPLRPPPGKNSCRYWGIIIVAVQPVTRRVWSLRGVRPVCPVNPRYEWAYVYGAAEVGGQARVEFCYFPSVSLEWSQLFLEQVGAREPEATHVVLWDSGGLSPRRRRGGPAGERAAPTHAVLQSGT